MAGDGFTPAQLQQLRQLFREELADCGLRVDGDHQDDARRDFMFLRSLRQAWDSAAGKIGSAILMSAVVVVGTILTIGFWGWLQQHLGTPPGNTPP